MPPPRAPLVVMVTAPSSAKPTIDAWLVGEMGRGVLTVGEDADFLASGGMINFIIDDRRVRFDINQKAVENSSLKLSSKLFQVARKVEK